MSFQGYENEIKRQIEIDNDDAKLRNTFGMILIEISFHLFSKKDSTLVSLLTKYFISNAIQKMYDVKFFHYVSFLGGNS